MPISRCARSASSAGPSKSRRMMPRQLSAKPMFAARCCCGSSLDGYDGILLVSSEKSLGATGDLQADIDDVYDALITSAITPLAVAMEFDADDQSLEVQPYSP